MTIDRREFLFYDDLRYTGRGAVRLARLLWEQEVAGSNPVAPNHKCFAENGLRYDAEINSSAFFVGATPVLR